MSICLLCLSGRGVPEDKPAQQPAEADIQASETKAHEAFKCGDYAAVFSLVGGLRASGVKVMERTVCKHLILQSLNSIIAEKDKPKRIDFLKAFMAAELDAPALWRSEAGYCLVKDLCAERRDLDKVEELAVKFLKVHEDAIRELKDKPADERVQKAEHEKYMNLIGLACFVNSNFDEKKNFFLKNAPASSMPKFADVTEKSGLKGVSCERIAVADLDGDGKDDLLLDGCKVFLFAGDEKFAPAPDAGLPLAEAGICADADNDGLADVFCISGRQARVMMNAGSCKFREVKDQGIPECTNIINGAAVGDFNADGFVDFLVARGKKGRENDRDDLTPEKPALYMNAKNGKFADATDSSGVGSVAPMLGAGVSVCDYDGDGDQDIYVSNVNLDLDKNYLFENDGKGVFKDTASEHGIAGTPRVYQGNTYHGHTQGSAFGDLDGDGDFDVFAAAISDPRYIDVVGTSLLYVNKGKDGGFKFEDRFQSSGIRFSELITDCSLADADNDGDLDLFLSAVGDASQTFLYENDGQGRFLDATWQSRAVSFNAACHAWVDYDRDGDLDLVLASKGGMKLFRNGAHKRNGWIELRLFGSKSNNSALGAHVTVRAQGKTFVRHASCGRGNTSQDSAIIHFGLGKASKGDAEAEIRWPSGSVEKLKLAIGQRHTVKEK